MELPGFSSKVFLAPMAAVNCPAFRLICKEYGAGLVYTQMIDADDLVAQQSKLLTNYVGFSKDEHPVAAQIVGSNPANMVKAAKILEKHADVIDINLGCPDSNVLGKKAGAYLIKHPNMIERLIRPVIEATKLPVTAKIRSGWDEQSINAVEVSRILEEIGVKAIAVHARTRKQKYTGKADWDIIRQVKENVSIPIIGNGDILKPGAAKAMIEQTRCDYVMLGRGAIGNPFLFRRINYLLDHGKNMPEPTKEDIKKAFNKFTELYLKQERKKITELRQHAMWFTKGVKNAKQLKQKLMRVTDFKELNKIFMDNI